MTNSLPPLTRLLMIAEMIETEEVFDREEVANILIEIHNELSKNAMKDNTSNDHT